MTTPPLAARRAVPPDLVLAVAALGVFMEFVDSTIVNIAFPAIHRSFHATTISTLSWILNGYSIVFAAFLVVSGRLADLLGRRRVFRSGVMLFTAASALCGIAPNPGFLIGMRAMQAVGGAMVVPSSMALVIQAFPIERRARATTIYGATAALAAALGPPIGGALIKLQSWRLCFYINVPVGVLVLVLSTKLLVESRAPGRRSLPDVVGAIMLAAGLGLLTLGIVRGGQWGWGSPRTVSTFVLTAVAASGFVWRSSWHRSPIIDPALVRRRPFQVVNGAMLLAGAGFYGYLLCHALYLMLVWRYSALDAGLTFVPGALVAAVTAAASRRLEGRGFVALVVPGAVCWVGGMVWYWQVVGLRPEFVSQWLPGSVITGLGAGLVLPALGAAAIAATPGSGYAMAGALNTTARQIGGALGIALVVVLISGTPTPTSLRHGWVFAGSVFLVLVVLGGLLGGLRPAEADAEDGDTFAAVRPVGFDVGAAGTSWPTRPAESLPPVTGNLAAFLRTVPLFAALTGEQLEDIAGIAKTIRVSAGTLLFRRDDPADGLYILRAGRIEVLLQGADGIVRGDVGRGDVIGELALLADTRRAATVQAKRDSELIFIARADFELMLLAVPELSAALASRLARLIQQGQAVETAPHRALPATIAVLCEGASAHELADRLANALAGRVAVLDGAVAGDDLTNALDRAERQHDRVVLVANDMSDTEWHRFCVAQADAVLLAATGEPSAVRLPPGSCTVVVREQRDVRPWLRAHAAGVEAVVADVEALGRRFSGRSTGLVLSGGGAPALAHVGVIEGLETLGMTIDRIAAAGTGALIAAMLAAGWTSGEIDAACYEELVRRRPFGDYRVSRTALLRPDRVHAMLCRLFGDLWIEELPRGFVCVSADLVHGERVEHRSGRVADAVLAAITTPGLMPPVAAGDRLLVDAGVLDNLPIDLLAAVEGPLIAVDVAPRDRGPERLESGRRPRRGTERAPALPSLAESMARAMVLGSCGAAEAARRRADVSIVPDTRGVGMFEFHQLDVLRAAGRAAVRAAFRSAAS